MRPPHAAGRLRVIGAIVVAGIVVAGIVAVSIWQAHLSRRSPTAHWSVALLALTILGVAIALGQGRQHDTARRWTARNVHFVTTWRAQSRPAVLSVLIWSVLLAGAVGWDLVSFICQSHALPTLSYFIGHVTRHPLGRGLLVALWLSVGAYLASAGRVRSRR